MDTRIGAWQRGTAMPLGQLARISFDLITILAGFWLAYLLRYERHLGGAVAPESYRPFNDFLPLVALFAAILVPIFVAHGLFHSATGTNQRGSVRQVISCTLTAFMVLSTIVFYSRTFTYSRLVFVYALVFVTAFLIVLELCYPRIGSWASEFGYHRARLADIALVFVILLLGLPSMFVLLLSRWLRARRSPADQPPEAEFQLLPEAVDE